MSKRATLVLAAITAVMLLFIVVYEQNTISSGELESRRGQVLDRLIRSRVHGITLRRGAEVVVTLVRDREVEETLDTFDVGTWRLTAPVTGAADADSIDSLLLACEGLASRRTLETVSAEDRQRFGLDEPRIELTLEVADETQVVRVGADDEQLGATYVEVVGTGRVHLVGGDFFEALDQSTDHFRSKEVLPDLSTRDVTAVVLETRGADDTTVRSEVAFTDRRWVASAPFVGWARKSTIDAILDTMVEARVVRFAADGGEALLTPSSARVEVTVRDRDPEGRETGRLTHTTFVVGTACPAAAGGEGSPEEPGDLVAVRVDDGPIGCVSAASLQALVAATGTLRETRLLAVTEDQVERVLLATRGATTREIELRREGGDWQILEGDSSGPADEAAVAEYLRALRSQEAESFEAASDEALAARGLTTPVARVRLHRSDVEDLVETIDIGTEDTVGVWVRRSGEAVLARYVGDTAALLAATSLRFRARDLVSREPDDVLALEITRDGVEERLATENGAWRIEAPHALAADRIATRDLIRALAVLRAARWESDAPAPEHGLTPPRVRVHMTMREGTASSAQEADEDHGHEEEDEEEPDAGPPPPLPTSIVLLVGAPAEGGAFAQLEGQPGVFVLATDVVDALARPLVDRELIALDTSAATRIVLTSAQGTVTIERVGGAWMNGAAPAAPDATERFVERLRSLRARTVSAYGDTAAGPAVLTIQVIGPETSQTLEIGPTTGLGDAAAASARLTGVPVEFALAQESVTALASYRP